MCSILDARLDDGALVIPDENVLDEERFRPGVVAVDRFLDEAHFIHHDYPRGSFRS
jgi:hypothetical protein